MKTTDKTAVLTVASALLNTNLTTTSLDVKEELRKTGYFAKQREVSEFLQEIANEKNWNTSDNGNFKVYSNPSLNSQPIPVVNSNPTFLVASSTTVKGVKVDVKSSPSSGDWKVTVAGTIARPICFSSTYTRDQVRCAYAKLAGVNFVDTRSKRVK